MSPKLLNAQAHRLWAVCLAVFGALALTLSRAISPAWGDASVKSLGTVTVNSGRPTSLPIRIPATIEGVGREQIEHSVNTTYWAFHPYTQRTYVAELKFDL
jgi:hypothetical protein